jgi:NADH dehydrogenase [ubiquinone] 1 alpha subcomplex assembly factor 5
MAIIGRLSPAECQRTSAAVPQLFDTDLRALRRDRAARTGPELFLHERAFEDGLERIALVQRQFQNALLIGCPDPAWPGRLSQYAAKVEPIEPGPVFAARANAQTVVEDAWMPPEGVYDLVLAVGTLDTANDLLLALRLIRHGMKENALLIGALSGGNTLPQLRRAMRTADSLSGTAAPHVHPRVEAAALAPLLSEAGFAHPVVDVDRAAVSYPSFERLVADLRAMGSTNILNARPRFVGRAAREAAARAFTEAGDGSRTIETFEILHFAAWTAK